MWGASRGVLLIFSIFAAYKFIEMKHLFEIDDRSKTGKHLLPLLKELSKSGEGVNPLSTEDAEDNLLLRLMTEAAKSGIAPRKRVLAKLDIK